MKYIFAALLTLAVLAAPAQAQTILSLSATGTVLATPDEMVASLTVQATAPKAAAGQAEVNRLMEKSLASAKAVNGMTATTSDYNVYQTNTDSGKISGYQASQTLNLTMAAPGGIPPAAFSNLVSQLQSAGLLLNTLDGDLSAQGRQNASQAAITAAIQQLQAQAACIAKTLDKTVGTTKTLSVNLDNAGPVMPMRMMAMATASAPPPAAAPGPVNISANVSAEILLSP